MQKNIQISTNKKNGLFDITDLVKKAVHESSIVDGIVNVYVQGATAAIMIQENWDPNIPADVLKCLRTMVPKGVWLHDRIDGNGDAHIKAGIIGPSEVIPVEKGSLRLSTWQNIFLCEFDGPRQSREILITLI